MLLFMVADVFGYQNGNVINSSRAIPRLSLYTPSGRLDTLRSLCLYINPTITINSIDNSDYNNIIEEEEQARSFSRDISTVDRHARPGIESIRV
jgi:hypothetical protein